MNFVLYAVVAVGVVYGLYQFSNLAFYLFAQAFGYVDNLLQDRYMKKFRQKAMENLNRLEAIANNAQKYRNDKSEDLAA